MRICFQTNLQSIIILATIAVSGCAKSASSAAPEVATVEPEPAPVAPAPPAEEEPVPEESPATAQEEPNFSPGMSVTEATNAVPSNMERLNLEQERLAEPLMQSELYEPCGLKGNTHFSLKVAVWDGRAVGMDITTTPQNEALATCLRRQIETVEWEDKAKSLNTVEFKY